MKNTETSSRDNPAAPAKWLGADGLYAGAVIVWIVGVWATAFYVAAQAHADTSAGVGGNSFVFGSALASAGVVTAFSLKEFFGALRRIRGA